MRSKDATSVPCSPLRLTILCPANDRRWALAIKQEIKEYYKKNSVALWWKHSFGGKTNWDGIYIPTHNCCKFWVNKIGHCLVWRGTAKLNFPRFYQRCCFQLYGKLRTKQPRLKATVLGSGGVIAFWNYRVHGSEKAASFTKPFYETIWRSFSKNHRSNKQLLCNKTGSSL